MTDAEQCLWQCLRGKQLDGFRFRKQHPIADFRGQKMTHTFSHTMAEVRGT
jgi:very-short-patch-repair endonuclease